MIIWRLFVFMLLRQGFRQSDFAFDKHLMVLLILSTDKHGVSIGSNLWRPIGSLYSVCSTPPPPPPLPRHLPCLV
jgi:hypothetical protein